MRRCVDVNNLSPRLAEEIFPEVVLAEEIFPEVGGVTFAIFGEDLSNFRFILLSNHHPMERFLLLKNSH
jgi:hypothetical protein